MPRDSGAVAVAFAEAALPAGAATPARVLVAALLLAWLVLPVSFDPLSDFKEFTPGSALPGAALITKAAAIPLFALLASLVLCRPAWRAFRLRWLDGAMAAFCAMPLLHGRALDALYLACAWLALWLLGRVLLAGSTARADGVALIAFTALALLPIALVEGMRPPWLHGAIYGPHPFQTAGAERFMGFRPVGFFEDGNQYGIWTAMAALAGVELARRDRRWDWVAIVLIVIALASQSVGAIALLIVGVALLLWRPRLPRRALPIASAALLAGGGLYLTGAVPLDHLARNTAVGQAGLSAFRAVGRGSLPWRISQDQRALPLIAERPVIGHGRWDWWRPLGRRPWGLVMLVIGQYGLLGFGLLAAALLGGAFAVLARGVRDERFAMAVIVLLTGVDAMLNSTIFFPAILLAGALACGREEGA